MARHGSAKATLMRQWHMLREIPRHPRRISVAEIKNRLDSAGYSVTTRSIQRDLIDLSSFFPLQSDERERPYGWSWKKDAPSFEMPNLSNQEALAFAMVERYLRPLLPHALLGQLDPYFKRAKERLGGDATSRSARSWLRKVAVVQPTQALLPPKIDAAVHAALTDALLLDRRVRIRYRRKGDAAAQEYELNPLGLVQRGPVSYVVGTLWDYEDVRMFAVHRIERAEPLEQTVKRPQGFSLDEWAEDGRFSFGIGKKIRLRALFDKNAAEHLSETPLSIDQRMRENIDGRVLVEVTVADTPQLRWWLRGFGELVEVCAPTRMRREFTDAAAEIWALYGGSEDQAQKRKGDLCRQKKSTNSE